MDLCKGMQQNSEFRNHSCSLELKYKHRGLASVAPPSTMIVMADGDGSPRIARTLRIKSTGQPSASQSLTCTPSIERSATTAPCTTVSESEMRTRGNRDESSDVAAELELRWLLSRSLTWSATGLCSLLGHFTYWAESWPGRDGVGQVLRKSNLVGRMVAWSIQLSEFDISFEIRGHVKAQALADFITELTPIGTPTAEEGEWYLSVDGSSNQTGSGAGVILEGPEGVLIEQSLHFEFRASNNQEEYEALLASMKLARELEAKKLMAKSDSKLVTRQVNGEYQARDP
ncbi:hypothetical protein CR513_40270, partial [Mucuna pruriens]